MKGTLHFVVMQLEFSASWKFRSLPECRTSHDSTETQKIAVGVER